MNNHRTKTLAALCCLSALGLFRAARGQDGSRSVWDGVYTEEQAKRGSDLYATECSRCHGATMTGGGEEAPPLAGPAFLANWSGLTVGDLFERVRITMPPNSPRRIAREKNVDILAHVLSVNAFPAGKAELPQETERLKLIRIDATKP